MRFRKQTTSAQHLAVAVTRGIHDFSIRYLDKWAIEHHLSAGDRGGATDAIVSTSRFAAALRAHSTREIPFQWLRRLGVAKMLNALKESAGNGLCADMSEISDFLFDSRVSDTALAFAEAAHASATEPTHRVSTSRALGNALSLQDRHNEAADWYGRGLDCARDFLNDTHPELLQTMNDFALCLSALGMHTDAIELAERALEKRRLAAATQADGSILESLHNLSVILLTKGDIVEALAISDELEPILATTLPPSAPVALIWNITRAQILCRLSRLEEALDLATVVADQRRTTLGRAHPAYLAAARTRAKMLGLAGRESDAVKALADVLAWALEWPGATDRWAAWAGCRAVLDILNLPDAIVDPVREVLVGHCGPPGDATLQFREFAAKVMLDRGRLREARDISIHLAGELARNEGQGSTSHLRVSTISVLALARAGLFEEAATISIRIVRLLLASSRTADEVRQWVLFALRALARCERPRSCRLLIDILRAGEARQPPEDSHEFVDALAWTLSLAGEVDGARELLKKETPHERESLRLLAMLLDACEMGERDVANRIVARLHGSRSLAVLGDVAASIVSDGFERR